MTLLSIILLSFLFQLTDKSNGADVMYSAFEQAQMMPIDSADHVIIDLDNLSYDGEFIEVPVYIESDEVINTLDFSFLVNVANLQFDSVVDHMGDLQYAAFLNPTDLKFRFTSNSFSSYPITPDIVVSLRFKVLSGIVHRSDFQMILSYLNGEKCSNELQSVTEDILLANDDPAYTLVSLVPNPASDLLYVNTEVVSKMNMYDLQGKAVIQNLPIRASVRNVVHVDALPRGMYTVQLKAKGHVMKKHKK